MDVEAVLAAARGAVVESLSRAELDSLAAHLGAVRSWCDATEVRLVRRARQIGATLDDVLTEGGRRSARHVRTAAAREEACALMPSFESALGAGDVAAGHIDALASASRDLDDPARAAFAAHETALLVAARRQPIGEFARGARDLARQVVGEQIHVSDSERLARQHKQSHVRRWVDDTTGMHHTHLVFDPLRDEAWWKAVQAQLGRLRQHDGNRGTSFAQLEVEAVVTSASGGPGGERIPEISILVDWLTLLDQAHAHGVCETVDGIPIPLVTVRRLCCDAHILPVVLGSSGEVLDLGRAERTTNRAQRRALRAMHRTCGHPRCTVPFDACRIHHVRWWWQHGGPTDLANLLPLCEQHHHLVHEGGWQLTMTAGRVATWTRPDGSVFYTGPTIDRRSQGVPTVAGTGARAAPERVAS
jgi:hypothetical protein